MTEKIIIAIIGVTGAVIGSIATVAVQWLRYYLEERSQEKKAEPRKRILKQMLKNPRHSWRKLETLMHVIGADEETTKRLLLEIGARASEDGQALWGLIERNPLPQSE